MQPIDPEKYPNLAANRALLRALHIHRAMDTGMTREQANRHADEHVGPLMRARTRKLATATPAPRRGQAKATRRKGKR